MSEIIIALRNAETYLRHTMPRNVKDAVERGSIKFSFDPMIFLSLLNNIEASAVNEKNTGITSLIENYGYKDKLTAIHNGYIEKINEAISGKITLDQLNGYVNNSLSLIGFESLVFQIKETLRGNTYSSHVQKPRDFFISYASEDRSFVEELVHELEENGLSYWVDSEDLKIGDSLRKVIDQGVQESKFGIIVLSSKYMGKYWTNVELVGLLNKETVENQVVLPIWHNVDESDVKKFSLTFADKVALTSKIGVKEIVKKLRDKVHNN